MLRNATAPFPQVNSFGFLKPAADPIQIIRRNPATNGQPETAFIRYTDPARLDSKIASGNTTVPLADLAETHELAYTINDNTKPRRRRARRSAR